MGKQVIAPVHLIIFQKFQKISPYFQLKKGFDLHDAALSAIL